MLYKHSGFSNILIGIIITTFLIGIAVVITFVAKRSNNPVPLSTEQTTNLSSDNSDNRAIPTPTPTPPSASKSAPAQSQKSQPILDVFVIQDDGTLIRSDNSFSLRNVTKRFYSLYPDKIYYDFLNIFTAFENHPSIGNIHDMVWNDVKNIGGPQIASSPFGTSNKLLGINSFGWSLTSPFIKTEEDVKTNLWLIAHEMAHQWLMYTGYSEGLSDGAHYIKWADTSFIRDGEEWTDRMGGWPWKDNGNGTLSVSNIQKQGFSKLSLYLMGLIPSSEVPDLRIVVPENLQDQAFQNVRGKFKTISIDDIVVKYGERIPSYQNSQKNFRVAYILLTKKGEIPTQQQLDNMNFIAKNFPAEWSFITYGKSTINQ